jgi:hypothetical protein
MGKPSARCMLNCIEQNHTSHGHHSSDMFFPPREDYVKRNTNGKNIRPSHVAGLSVVGLGPPPTT